MHTARSSGSETVDQHEPTPGPDLDHPQREATDHQESAPEPDPHAQTTDDAGDTGDPTEPDDIDGPRRPTATDTRRRRRRRRRRIVLAVLAALVVVIAFVMRNPSPVGHWDDAVGQDRYLAAYDEAFETLPEPDQASDLRTDYGFVRVYRFDGSTDAETPMVLLPGTASGSPVMGDNLPSLLELGDVYLIDLLGQPGRSVQERPISSSADQAEWLDQTLAQLPEDTFHLMGLSIGGWTATNLALHAPARVETLTVIDPVHVFDDLPLGTVVRSIPAAFPWLPKSWRDSFNSYTAGGAPVEDVPVADMIEAGMQHYRMKLPQPERITPDQLATLEVPVLAFIAGESVMHDPQVATETAETALTDGTV